MEIKKKTWPEWFQKVKTGKKTVEIRLADFEVNDGDVLVLEEWDPNTKEYTGDVLRKEVKNVNKVRMSDFHSIEDIEKFGLWVIELE